MMGLIFFALGLLIYRNYLNNVERYKEARKLAEPFNTSKDEV